MKRIFSSPIILILSLVYTAALLTVSLIKIESDSISAVSFPNADKVVHFCMYFGLTLLWHLYFFKRKNVSSYEPNLWICGGAILFGIIVEILQKELTTYRGFELLDILANSLGVLMAYVILRGFGRKIQALVA